MAIKWGPIRRAARNRSQRYQDPCSSGVVGTAICIYSKLSVVNPLACRCVLWILLVRSCTVCFVFVLPRLSPWRGFLPRLTLTPPSPPSSSSFRLDLSLRCGGLNSAHASLNTGLAILLSFWWLFPFFLLCLPSVCSVASYIQDLMAFVPNTYYTHNLSKYSLFQSRSQYDLFQNPGLHTCWTNHLLHKELFYTKTVLSTNTMFYTKTMPLLGLCKGCLQPTG